MGKISRMLAVISIIAFNTDIAFSLPIGFQFQSGIRTATVYDGQSGDHSGLSNVIVYTGIVGDWRISLTGLGPGDSNPRQMNVSFVDSSTSTTGVNPLEVAGICNPTNYPTSVSTTSSTSQDTVHHTTTTVTSTTTLTQSATCTRNLPTVPSTPAPLQILFSAPGQVGALSGFDLDFHGTNLNTTAQYAAYFDFTNGGSNYFTTPSVGFIDSTALELGATFSEQGSGAGFFSDQPYSLTEKITINAVQNTPIRKPDVWVGTNNFKLKTIADTCVTDSQNRTTCQRQITASYGSQSLLAPQYQYRYEVSGDANLSYTAVPESPTLVLLVVSLVGLVLIGWRTTG